MKYLVAIGDIHGMANKLKDLLANIRVTMDNENLQFATDYNIVFLGDYVDRGPDTAGVIRQVRELQKLGAIALRGNHEAMLFSCVNTLEGVYDPSIFNSYNGNDRSFFADIDWIRYLPLYHETDNHFFVHAGIDPFRDLKNQHVDDLLWTRSFHYFRGPLQKYVVYGHTPNTAGPTIEEYKTNLDTGACFGGPLTAGVFDLTKTKPIDIIRSI